MLPPTSPREILFACPPSLPWNLLFFTVESTWLPLSFSPRCGSGSPWLSPTLRSGNLDRWLCSFPLWQRRLWRTCQLLTLWHWGDFFSAGPVCSSFFPLKPVPFCKLSAGLGSTNKSATSLLLSDSRSVLSSVFSFVLISLTDLAGTVFSLLLFYQATMGPWTFVSPRERCGWCVGQMGSAATALSNPF